jgi:hypothetical protein
MISGLHKFYPFVFPDPVDLKQVAHDRRVARLNEQNDLAIQYAKIAKKVRELEVEIYDKRSEQNKIRLEIFSDRKVDFFA